MKGFSFIFYNRSLSVHFSHISRFRTKPHIPHTNNGYLQHTIVTFKNHTKVSLSIREIMHIDNSSGMRFHGYLKIVSRPSLITAAGSCGQLESWHEKLRSFAKRCGHNKGEMCAHRDVRNMEVPWAYSGFCEGTAVVGEFRKVILVLTALLRRSRCEKIFESKVVEVK